MSKDILAQTLNKYPDLADSKELIWGAFELLQSSFVAGGKLLVCGNGGSAADSDHIVGELMKGFMSRRSMPLSEQHSLMEMYGEEGKWMAEHLQRALPAISLCGHHALITAFANDVDADLIFAQQIYGYGNRADVLLAISTSGNSVNMIHALRLAKFKGMKTIGLTGRTGGKMKEFCDVAITVPYDKTPDIQERHLPIYHALCVMLEKAFFPNG